VLPSLTLFEAIDSVACALDTFDREEHVLRQNIHPALLGELQDCRNQIIVLMEMDEYAALFVVWRIQSITKYLRALVQQNDEKISTMPDFIRR
jgi:hypothetical protein